MAYACGICGLHYESKALAEECSEWCSVHTSCNLRIAKQSNEAKASKMAR